MRIYLSVDMEGLAGVAHPHQVVHGIDGVDRTDYDRSRALMAGEANAAIEAAVAAGANEVVVNDSHWRMRNLRAEDVHPAARLVIGDKPYSMTEGAAPDDGAAAFAAAAFIGYHAGAGHPTGVIAHTYSSAAVQGVRIDDIPHNEAALNALRLGHLGIPVALVSGDDALAAEVEQLLPWAERVVVKRALGYGVAASLSPAEARAAIADGMRRALARVGELPLYTRPSPIRCEVDLRLAGMADYAAIVPGVERIGPRTVAFDVPDAELLYRTFLTVVRMANVPDA